MKRYVNILFAVVLGCVAVSARTPREVPNVHVERAGSHVSNPDGVLSAVAQARLDSIAEGIWNGTTAEISIVAVGDMSGQDVDSYATELFELWGIGKKDKDNGVLVLVSRDDRKAAIRTGYGMEGVVTDRLAGSVIRDIMAPYFREGDYDSGMIKATEALSAVIVNPENAEELMSQYANNAGARSSEKDNFFTTYLLICVVVTVAMLAVFLSTLIRTRRLDSFERYSTLEKLRLPGLMVMCATLGMGILMWLPLVLTMRHIRLKKRRCPNCGHRMHRVDEVHDNDYLTPAQDMEERLNSVDYDVWLCPECGETDILPYVNNTKSYTVCPDCGARALSLQANRIVRQPTTTQEGQGVKSYVCHNCHHTTNKLYRIAKVVAPPVIIGGGGRGFGGGGGGFSGGSFGGGLTGGGGASGGW